MERTEISACHEKECYEGLCNSGARDRMREKRIRIATKYAQHLFAVNPDLLYFLPEPCSSFLPYSISSWYEIKALPYQIDRKIKILHSPTNRAAKGSGFIIQALNNLEKRYPIEILIIENLPHQKALEAYQSSRHHHRPDPGRVVWRPGRRRDEDGKARVCVYQGRRSTPYSDRDGQGSSRGRYPYHSLHD